MHNTASSAGYRARKHRCFKQAMLSGPSLALSFQFEANITRCCTNYGLPLEKFEKIEQNERAYNYNVRMKRRGYRAAKID